MKVIRDNEERAGGGGEGGLIKGSIFIINVECGGVLLLVPDAWKFFCLGILAG